MKLSLLKFLHKFLNREGLPWVNLIWERYYQNGRLPSVANKGSFWWMDIVKLLDNYKGLAIVSIHDGKSYLIWDDLVPKLSFPELYSFSGKKRSPLLNNYLEEIVDMIAWKLANGEFLD